MKISPERFLKRVGRLGVFTAVCVAVWAAAVIPMAAQDFDFYANDLISQESYKKISMDFRDASLKDILKIFSEQSGLNFIASQSVQDRTVTLYLDQVPLQDALDKIMAANNLTYKLEPGSNIFTVQETGRPAIEVVTKVYALKYSHLGGSKIQTQIDAMKEASSEGSQSSESGGSSSSGGADGASGSIETVVQNVLSPSGKMIVDQRTNSIIVTDVPAQFDVIDRVVALLDTPTPQVMIEVEMLDVSKRTIDEMGVDTSSGILQLTGGKVDTRFPNFMGDAVSQLMSTVQADTVGDPGVQVKTFQYGTLDASIFTALLEYLTTDTRTKYLARPRILTMSNQKAIIQISTQEAIGQNMVTSSTGSASTTTVEAERYATGVTLVVTPQVDTDSRMVTMAVEPTVTEAKTGATFNGTTYKDPEVRSSKSTLVVKDGETIVVGGLIRNRLEKTVKKMPILGDIPLIGMMFRHTDNSEEERELLVFITPRIAGLENAAMLAQAAVARPVGTSRSAGREQPIGVSRKRQVDNMLERWEN
jgi:type IV pilus assembly protein PilQ